MGPGWTVAEGHVRGSVHVEAGVRIFDQRYRPSDDLAGHLLFALKYETLDLLVLSRLFRHLGRDVVAGIVGGNPARQYVRRLWYSRSTSKYVSSWSWHKWSGYHAKP